MIFIALVAVAVWLADLRLAVALSLVALAWVIAATIEYLAWRSARGPVAFVEAGTVAAPPAPPPVLSPDSEPAAEVEPEPVPKPPSVEQTIVAPPAPPVEPEPEAVAEPEPEPEPAPEEPEPEPEEPEPEPELAETLPVTPEQEPPDAEPQQSRWGMRKRLRAVPAPPPEPVPEAAPEVVEQRVVPLPQRSYVPQQWNLWDLERLVRAEAQEYPERRDEWAFLFVHLRQFANADGVLPAEFDSLVRESFGDVLERQPSR